MHPRFVLSLLTLTTSALMNTPITQLVVRCRKFSGGVISKALLRAICAACVVFISSCIMLPIPSTSGPLPPFFSRERVDSVHAGMSRADVLMTLGNPYLVAQNDAYLGYQWLETPQDWFFAWGIAPGAAGATTFRGDPSDEHMLMLEFDSAGKVVRFKEFSNMDASALRNEIRQWIRAAAAQPR